MSSSRLPTSNFYPHFAPRIAPQPIFMPNSSLFYYAGAPIMKMIPPAVPRISHYCYPQMTFPAPPSIEQEKEGQIIEGSSNVSKEEVMETDKAETEQNPEPVKKETVKVAKKKSNTWSSHTKNFTSAWQVTTMKGHTGQVLDVDYSSNGKYIASCGEEESSCSSGSSSGSECGGKENDIDIEEAPQPSPTSKGLSRRQRKNRRREETPPKKIQHEPLLQFTKLNINENMFCNLLYSHLLTPEQMFIAGYPLQDPNYKNRVVHFNANTFSRPRQKQHFDVNAQEFVPRCDTESSSSSDSENSEIDIDLCPVQEESVERVCARCNSGFFVTRTDYLTQERCFYHWGKLHNHKGHSMYTCCQGRLGSAGCTTSKLHVWNGSEPGMNVKSGFVKTRNKRTKPTEGSYGVYALDCEMCYTVAGLEVTKITVVSMDGKLVYDTYVQPVNEIIDYNTRFSGITAKDLNKNNNNVKSLKQVQNDLRGFINAKTILIGHGLNNDLCALKMVHMSVVDTSLSFPHYNGYPFRRSLKSLMNQILHKEIQCHSGGHNSYEDACACMELMLYRVGNEYKGFV